MKGKDSGNVKKKIEQHDPAVLYSRYTLESKKHII